MTMWNKIGVVAGIIALSAISSALAQFVISPPVSTININGHTYTNAMWQSNPGGTMGAVANDIAAVTSAYPTGRFAPRVVLTSDLNLYVSTAGSDSAGVNCFSGTPCRTIQHVWDTLSHGYDLHGFTAYIHVADGTYTGKNAFIGQIPGWSGVSNGWAIVIQGNPGTPSNVVINCASSSDYGIYAYGTPSIQINGFKLNGCFYSIWSDQGAALDLLNINYGAATNTHIVASVGGYVQEDGTDTVSGDAVAHYWSFVSGIIYDPNPHTTTFIGTRNFSTGYAVGSQHGTIVNTNTTFNGTVSSVTGRRYSSAEGALIDTQGQGITYFPGDSAGTTSSGGVYN